MEAESDSEDEITLKADLAQSHDIHKLGTMLCEGNKLSTENVINGVGNYEL